MNRLPSTIHAVVLITALLLPDYRFPAEATTCSGGCGCTAELRAAGACCCAGGSASTRETKAADGCRSSCCETSSGDAPACEASADQASGCKSDAAKPSCCGSSTSCDSSETARCVGEDATCQDDVSAVVSRCPCGGGDETKLVTSMPRTRPARSLVAMNLKPIEWLITASDRSLDVGRDRPLRPPQSV